MKSVEWKEILKKEVEKRFEDSAPSIKLAILVDMYDAEPMDIEIGKELAYEILGNEYSEQADEIKSEGTE